MAVLEGTARRAVDRVAEELLGASATSVTPPPLGPFGASSIDFQKVIGCDGGTPQFGPVHRFELQSEASDPFDGEDNDLDGIVDEQELHWIRNPELVNESVEVLAAGIPQYLEGEQANGLDDNGNGLIDEPGFSVVLAGVVLRVRLTLGAREPGGRILLRTVETAIVVRN